MAHAEQKEFMTSVKERFPEKFVNCRVLDIGSLDINGSIKELFENSEYVCDAILWLLYAVYSVSNNAMVGDNIFLIVDM